MNAHRSHHAPYLHRLRAVAVAVLAASGLLLTALDTPAIPPSETTTVAQGGDTTNDTPWG